MNMHVDLAPLTWGRAFTTWRFSPITTVCIAGALALYMAGVFAVNRRNDSGGDRWPWWRLAYFSMGLAVVAAAIMGSPGVYGDAGLFWVHMLQHLMLIMIAPWLLCYGHPAGLLLSATHGGAGRRVEAVLSSRVVRVLTFPVVPLAIYVGVIVGVHLSAFMDAMVASSALMIIERVIYLGSGYLYFSQILTHDSPGQGRSYPLRLASLFMAMSADTIVGVVFVQATRSPFPHLAAMQPSWGPGALADVHGAGAMMWIGGDGLMFVMMLVVAVAWMTDRSPAAARAGSFLEAARQSALAGTGADSGAARENLRASHDVDEDDAALDAYNTLLARLNRSEGHG